MTRPDDSPDHSGERRRGDRTACVPAVRQSASAARRVPSPLTCQGPALEDGWGGSERGLASRQVQTR